MSFILAGQFAQPRAVQPGQRTIDAQERQHHQFLVGQFRQRVRVAMRVAQREVSDLLAEQPIIGGPRAPPLHKQTTARIMLDRAVAFIVDLTRD